MSDNATAARFGVRQAAFIGVGSMVGAGIFSLLGAAGEIAGAAVWLSFVFAGVIAALQGYSFAKLGARYPSAGGMIEYLNQEFGRGHASTVAAWLGYFVNVIVTAMVAVSFGSYASATFANGDPSATKVFAAGLVIAMTLLNIAGSTLVARVQGIVVVVVIGILAFFAVVTIATATPARLDPATYPPLQQILSSVALTFFAFLGFGIITFTAKDLSDPGRQLPRAMGLAIGIATVIYVTVAIGVFGTLDVADVIAYGPVAIAVAAKPVLGDAGYLLMTVTALFATAGATNAGLYPASGLGKHLAKTGQFPTIMGRDLRDRVSFSLLVASAITLVNVILFDLSAIASIGSAVALLLFALISAGHFRVRPETGANVVLLVLAVTTSSLALSVFVVTTLIKDVPSMIALVGLLVASIALDLIWAQARQRQVPSEKGAAP